MDAYVRLMYLREEEFLETYWATAEAVIATTGIDWRPNYRCPQLDRWRRQRFGLTEQLTFREAVIFHDRGGAFSSILLKLESSRRLLVLRVTWERGTMEVQTKIDESRTR